MNGTISVSGNASSTVEGFYYGLTSSYGSIASTTGTFGPGTFSQNLTGLTPSTTYHFQAFAINSGGTGISSDATFTTASVPNTTTTVSTAVGIPTPGGGYYSPPISPQTFAVAPVCPPGALYNSETGAPCSINLAVPTPQLVAPTIIPVIPPQILTFTATLQAGSTGGEVRLLQQYLNQHGFAVSSAGPGSAGDETTYFGSATKAALIQFQKAHGIQPAIGYFGPITKAYIQSHA